MADAYTSFTDLAAHESLGVDYRVSARAVNASNGAHIAIHGGGIEAPTTQLADYCAAESQSSYYAFEGIRSSNNTALHVTSTRFNDPALFRILTRTDWTISWHGASGTEHVTYVGGGDLELAAAVSARLKAAGFTVVEAPTEIDGNDVLNVTNRNRRQAGVQLELSRGLRESFYASGELTLATIADPANRSDAFYAYTRAVLAAVATTWPSTRQGPPTGSRSAAAAVQMSSSTAGYPGAGSLQLRMPFQLDAMGRLAVITTPDQMLTQRARGVVATVPGEYVGVPAFGSDISHALFRPSDPIAPLIIGEAVKSSMARWEPNAAITSIDPVVHDDQEGIVDVRVQVADSGTPGIEVTQTEAVRVMPGGRVVGGSL
ncbi:poly-gamma-glutamate hydrolase family protein [Streptomyces goshikiensis]|uniref:poly-gamma-glutamate hydrolase family protein n=1 Tax=Streptomyces goshikiensis TaxID=1942 RepID=UPI0036694AA4